MQAILYNSNTGSAKSYANLLSDAVGLPAFSVKEAKRAIKKGSEVLYFGWVMASSVRGYRKAAKNYRVCAVAAVGMAATGTNTEIIREKNGLPRALPLFTLQGNFTPEKLAFPLRLMMRIATDALQKKKDRTEEEEETLRLMRGGEDRVRAENLAELLAWVRMQKDAHPSQDL